MSCLHKNLVVISFLFSTALIAQEEDKIFMLDEEIIVTASQIPTVFSDVARSISVLNKEEIARLPVQTVQDAIEYLSGVDMQQRGPNGIQSDVSIRGATFEQTLVLIDGVKVTDSQTGHHNMNIPLTLQDIEKIEVLKGPGSKQFGPNALGGVINIITKYAQDKEISLYETFGQNQFYDVGATIFVPVDKIQNRFSVQKSGSQGYRENTDFDIYTVSFGSRVQLNPGGEADILMGFNDKKFGANSFYSPNFPKQWERTKTFFIKAGWKYKSENYWYNARFNYRRNDDEFMLNRDNPAFYHNQHQTEAAGFETQAGLNSFLGITSIAAEYRIESISSNNLGDHKRNSTGLYLEHQIEKERFRIIMGGSFYQVSDWGWNLWPGIDGRFNITRQMHLFGSIGRAFRVPTFTELYYWDPANSGNADLKEEQAWIYEAGYGYSNSGFRAHISGFQRDSKQLIDWIWLESEKYWQVQNLSEIRTQGIETGIELRQAAENSLSFIKLLRLHYTFLNSVKDLQGRLSKYALSYLRHQIVAGVDHTLIFPSVQLAWKFRWEDRLLYDHNFITDLRINWKVKNVNLNLDVMNVWNHIYKDYFHIPLPGRWVKFGIQVKIL